MVKSLYGLFGWDVLATMEPLRLIVHLKFDFDYNSFTFVPTAAPRCAPISSLDGPTAAQINSLYDENMDSTRPPYMRGVELAPVISYIEYTGNQALVLPIMIDRNVVCSRVTFEAVVHNFKSGVTLTSRKREKWMPLKKENIKKQIEEIRNDSCFKDLIVHSLRMRSPEPLCASGNTVLVRVNEGFGLGEIKSFKRFEVVKSWKAEEEYKRKIRSGGGNNSEEDLHELFHSNSAAIVLFIGDSDAMCNVVTVDLAELGAPNNNNAAAEILTVQESDRKALEAFVALTRVSLPTVTTPPLK